MLIIDFTFLPLDRAVSPLWRSGTQIDLGAVNEMDLRYEYFWSQIEFIVDGTDIGYQWGSVPLLDFAASLKVALGSIARRERAEIDFTENSTRVSILRNGDLVGFGGAGLRIPLACQMSELSNAGRAFFEKITLTLSVRYPGIRQNEFFKKLTAGFGDAG
jgi:hypothetical protein